MSILFPHKDFSMDADHGKVFKTGNLGPIFIRWRPRGRLRNSRRHKRGGRARVPRPWPGAAHGPRPWPPLSWFLGILSLPLRLQRMNMSPKSLIQKSILWWILDARLLKETKLMQPYTNVVVSSWVVLSLLVPSRATGTIGPALQMLNGTRSTLFDARCEKIVEECLIG